MNNLISFRYDYDRAINAFLYVAQNIKRKDLHKIFKIIYFSDMEHLSEYGRPITGDNYIAMKNGPVPSALYNEVKAVRDFCDPDNLASNSYSVENYIVSLHRPADTESLSVTDLEVLDKNILKLKDKSFLELTEMSHGYAWQKANRNNGICFEDILKEAGDDREYVNYIKEQSLLALQ